MGSQPDENDKPAEASEASSTETSSTTDSAQNAVSESATADRPEKKEVSATKIEEPVTANDPTSATELGKDSDIASDVVLDKDSDKIPGKEPRNESGTDAPAGVEGAFRRTELSATATHKFQPHQAKIFNDLLEKTAPDVAVEGRSYKHPIIIDGLLGIGLLIAMAGFTLGAVKIYIVHEAKHDITDQRYAEAIALLKSAPMPGFFQIQGESPEDLLDQAHYLEAIEKLDKDNSDGEALKELDTIRPGSQFFEMANNIKSEHAPVSPITLQGGTEHEATPAEVKAADRPLLPETNSGSL